MNTVVTLSIISNFSEIYNNNTEYFDDLKFIAEKELFAAEIQNAISFQYYTGSTVYQYSTYSLWNAHKILQEPTFDNSLNTVLYLHGYGENAALHAADQSVDIVIGEFLKKHEVNLIAANYGELVWKVPGSLNIEYLRATLKIPYVGRYVGEAFRSFVSSCRCQQRMHIIGFSLGAHVAHYASRVLKQDGVTVARITGLEPARPFFEGNILKEHLEETDAVFVDIVHSDTGDLGWSSHIGHADFWPNKGVAGQPYCTARSDTTPKCNHYCSVRYYAAAISNPDLFPAQRCPNGDQWSAGSCTYNSVVYFGYTLTFTFGDYYFSTTATYPYGKGEAGLIPHLFYNYYYDYYLYYK